MTEAQILEDFPDLEETDIRACVAFAAGNRIEVEDCRQSLDHLAKVW